MFCCVRCFCFSSFIRIIHSNPYLCQRKTILERMSFGTIARVSRQEPLPITQNSKTARSDPYTYTHTHTEPTFSHSHDLIKRDAEPKEKAICRRAKWNFVCQWNFHSHFYTATILIEWMSRQHYSKYKRLLLFFFSFEVQRKPMRAKAREKKEEIE